MREFDFMRETLVWQEFFARQSRRRRQIWAGTLACLVLSMLYSARANHPEASQTAPLARLMGAFRAGELRIDLNSAEILDLVQVPGLSHAMAAKITAFRDVFGGFRSFEDLLRIPGLSHNLCERLKPFLLMGPS